MAPLSAALKTKFVREMKGNDGASVYVYEGVADKEWCIIAVAQGGYVVALALDAVTRLQSATRHPDPVHLTAHFLGPAIDGPFEVHVRIIKAGTGAFTILSAGFMQKGREILRLHAIFGNLTVPADYKSTRPDMTVEPPSPYATQIPVETHPSKCPLLPEDPKWLYLTAAETRMQLARDPIYDDLWKPGPMEACNYITLTDEDEVITPTMLSIFADIFLSFAAKNPKLPSWTFWCATVVFSLEFKCPLPKPGSADHSPRTVAAYHKGKFFNEPHGRHEIYMEIWTAPANVGDGPETEREDWKIHQRCLAIAHQMVIIVDIDKMPGAGRDKLKSVIRSPKL